MEYLFIYCLQLADALASLTTALLIATPFAAVATSLLYTDYDEWYEMARSNIKKLLFIWFGIPLIITMLPTKETLLLMGGTYLGKKAVNQVVTSQKLEKVNTIIDLQLDKYIKELKEVTK